ncbi:MAG: hypothetical protein CXT67_01630 [Methanobacteriota archaeon]|jgi:hypothetical protein|nr:MAG: hypothetical protein CXT67_01630 [Euryarchaeota archaeon]HIG20569.1 hypothetical protein [Candidatus Poseidoniales archaeon]
MDGKTGTPEEHDTAPLPMREWLVEYIVERAQKETLHCLTVLRGRNVEDVQTRLYSELRENFPLELKLEVTVTRMVPVDVDTDEALFEMQGTYQP